MFVHLVLAVFGPEQLSALESILFMHQLFAIFVGIAGSHYAQAIFDFVHTLEKERRSFGIEFVVKHAPAYLRCGLDFEPQARS